MRLSRKRRGEKASWVAMTETRVKANRERDDEQPEARRPELGPGAGYLEMARAGRQVKTRD